MLRTALLAATLSLLAACGGGGHGAPSPSAEAGGAPADGPDASLSAPPDAGGALDAPDAAACDGGPLPERLSCTGLYADVAAKTVAPGVEAFAPSVPLWSDGSGKSRWVYLPPGTPIDRTDPDDWVFPNGTKLWKEFSRDGGRKETRFFHKQDDGTWAWVSYVWDAAESDAIATPAGASLPLDDGSTYAVPSQEQCADCHDGRPEHVLGFEEVSLGMPGATGLTLDRLAAQGAPGVDASGDDAGGADAAEASDASVGSPG